jgi:hypothetical protein
VPVGAAVEMRFFVPESVESENAVGNWHYRKRSAWRAGWVEGVIAACDDHADELATVAGAVVALDVALPWRHQMDELNLAVTAKPLIDGIVRSGRVMRDDSPGTSVRRNLVGWQPASSGLVSVRFTVAATGADAAPAVRE